MDPVLDILLTTNHLLDPCGEFQKREEVGTLERTVSIVALIILGLLTIGAVPIFYYFMAKEKLAKSNTINGNNGFDSQGNHFTQTTSPEYSNNLQCRHKILQSTQSKEELISDNLPSETYFNHTLDASQLPATIKSEKYQNRFNLAQKVTQVAGMLVSPIINFFVPGIKPSVDILAKGDLEEIHHLGGQFLAPGKMEDPNVKQRSVDARNRLSDFLEKNSAAWYCKRVKISSNGQNLNAYIVGKKENLMSGRWTMFSLGLGEIADEAIFHRMGHIDELKTNCIIYNYPGVGLSQGPSSRNGHVASHETVLSLLEDKNNGLGAKEIICWGTSMGGGVQGHAFKRHKFKPDIRYAIVEDNTYCTLSEGSASTTRYSITGAAVKRIGWQLSSKTSMLNLKHHKIIIQKAKNLEPKDASDILNDGLFTPESSLAGKLLSSGRPLANTTIIGVKADHCQGFTKEELDKIYLSINTALKTPVESA